MVLLNKKRPGEKGFREGSGGQGGSSHRFCVRPGEQRNRRAGRSDPGIVFSTEKISFNDEIYITNLRHKQALEAADSSLKLVEQSIADQMPEDFYSIDLMDAYESLGKILGESVGEDLINEIFSKFCTGK